jgi:U3 small nucleolar RNA-associated protein 19
MPTATAGEGAKRKRLSNGEKSVKRRRSTGEEEDPNAKILLMEQGILESKKNYNDITVLLTMMRQFDSGNEESLLAAVALCRVFVRLLAQGSLVPKKDLSDKERVVVSWLKDHFFQYKSELLLLLKDEDVGVTALTLCMRALKAEGEFLYDKDDYTFPRKFLEQIVAVIAAPGQEEVRKAFLEEYLEQYDDIRYFTFKSVK